MSKKIFDEALFKAALHEYRKAPTLAALELIVTNHILPLTRGYCFSRYVKAAYEDREDFSQIAAVRCVAKLHLLYRNGYRRAHPYLTKLTQRVVQERQKRIAHREKHEISIHTPLTTANAHD